MYTETNYSLPPCVLILFCEFHEAQTKHYGISIQKAIWTKEACQTEAYSIYC